MTTNHQDLDPSGDLRTSHGEVVRRVDLDAAASEPDLGVAVDARISLAKAALVGDQAALDQFHDLEGLVLPGVTERCQRFSNREVRLGTVEKWVLDEGESSAHVDKHVAFIAATDDCSSTAIDAAALVAWIWSPSGRAALARRGVSVPASTLTTEETIAAARNVGVDLTCDECAALFYTRCSSTPGHLPAHSPSCRTTGFAVWRRDTPPRGVWCLVTWMGPNGGSRPQIRVAWVSPDRDEECWFSDGKRIHHVVAWMPVPEPAPAHEPVTIT